MSLPLSVCEGVHVVMMVVDVSVMVPANSMENQMARRLASESQLLSHSTRTTGRPRRSFVCIPATRSLFFSDSNSMTRVT